MIEVNLPRLFRNPVSAPCEIVKKRGPNGPLFYVKLRGWLATAFAAPMACAASETTVSKRMATTTAMEFTGRTPASHGRRTERSLITPAGGTGDPAFTRRRFLGVHFVLSFDIRWIVECSAVRTPGDSSGISTTMNGSRIALPIPENFFFRPVFRLW
jgi:hypothetical protein